MATVSPPLPVAATRGSRIVLADGRELIDGIASWWTACHGYNHPHIRAAVAEQLDRMPHVMFGGLANEPALRLARRLAGILPDPLGRVFFSESGSVAVEIALKMALQYWLNQGVRGRHRFVSFQGAYHGDTFAAMSVCDPEEGMHSLFAGALPKQHVVPLPEDEAGMAAFDTYLARHGEDVAAVIVEPLVQGAGGMRFHVPETLRTLRAGLRQARSSAQVVPDIVTLSKALTGGTMALAATVASDRVFEAFLSDDADAALMHGPTFMANPLACAAANASLDLFEREPRLAQARAIEGHLAAALEPARELRGVVDVRVKGAIGVIQLDDMRRIDWLKARFVDAGVWVRPFADIVYVTPALTIDEADLTRLTDALTDVVTAWSRER
ncbi:Adenosylmethionine-8-amino-7-oxononanoate aminotransferase [Geodia barretti]|uniref:Adenosylmethionine-8-amino-7-oxononanoate aminotransferase n=1 Tax=Geodia barretti TaxID=519541 RepID=A0AA35TTA4_GEOBA|nr:Adenosylmethionine-8-amino-7-oxononanoate aminotransferase [Geodia barretti]